MKGIAKYSQECVDSTGLKRWVGLELEFEQNDKSPEEALAEVELKVSKAIGKSSGQVIHDNSTLIGPMPEIYVDRQIGTKPEDILSSPDLIVLDTYKILAKGKPELERAYALRCDQLTGK